MKLCELTKDFINDLPVIRGEGGLANYSDESIAKAFGLMKSMRPATHIDEVDAAMALVFLNPGAKDDIVALSLNAAEDIQKVIAGLVVQNKKLLEERNAFIRRLLNIEEEKI